MSVQNYRPDIDGLRAVAVTSVLLFHAFPTCLSGGYVGVDIFFVISGYLISSILIKETREGTFSILQFYVRRARRLFPALLVVLTCSLLAGWFAFFPGEWRALGKHTLAGSVFLSNLALWQEAGYFDSSADLKPLLHLWSLAVEEQFYLLWPIVIFATNRGSRTASLKYATAIGITLSLLASAFLTSRNPTLAFYFPLTRFWELLAGAWLATLGSKQPTNSALTGWVAHASSMVGLACLLVSMWTFTSSTLFPGYAAALPVVGAALLIQAGPAAAVNRVILSHPFAIKIGLISYPVYLWHWPILAFARIYFDNKELHPGFLGGLLLLSFILGWATYRHIERPFRSGPARSKAQALREAKWLWIGLLALGTFGTAIWRHGIPSHSEELPIVQKIDQVESDWEAIADQTWVGGKPGTVLFVGDSHMQHYAPRISEVMHTQSQNAHSVRLITLSGCAPVPGLNRDSVDCAHFTDQAFRAMEDPRVVTVVLAASWKGFSSRPDYYRTDDPQKQHLAPLADTSRWVLDNWSDRLRALRLAGKHIVVVLSSPRGPLVEPRHLVDRGLWHWTPVTQNWRNYDALKSVVLDVDRRVATVAQQVGAEVVDPFTEFCHNEHCDISTPDGKPIFMDDSHIRASYAHDQIHYLDRFFFMYSLP